MLRLQHGRTHSQKGEESIGSSTIRGCHVRERVCDATRSSTEPAYIHGGSTHALAGHPGPCIDIVHMLVHVSYEPGQFNLIIWDSSH